MGRRGGKGRGGGNHLGNCMLRRDSVGGGGWGEVCARKREKKRGCQISACTINLDNGIYYFYYRYCLTSDLELPL